MRITYMDFLTLYASSYSPSYMPIIVRTHLRTPLSTFPYTWLSILVLTLILPPTYPAIKPRWRLTLLNLLMDTLIPALTPKPLCLSLSLILPHSYWYSPLVLPPQSEPELMSPLQPSPDTDNPSHTHSCYFSLVLKGCRASLGAVHYRSVW